MATRDVRQSRRVITKRELQQRERRQHEPQDDDSDSEEPNLGLKRSDDREAQIIHSGHFMVSSPHIEHPPKKGYDFDTVNKQTCQTYHFGKTSTSHFSIDASLTKLFECMTLAYSGKLVSPKWKNFKGLKLQWRDKIRLNNAIWRAWYMQYVERRETPVCHFVTPLDGTMTSEAYRPAESVSTEGKYWKRRIEIVIREYHKWRTYFKKRLQKHKDDDLSSLLKGAEEQYSLFGGIFPDTLRVSLCQDEEVGARHCGRKSRDTPEPMEMDLLIDMDVLMSEFSDTLFSTLASHQSLGLPNSRDIAHAANADMIQPGLNPLQPNVDFMDSFEHYPDLFQRPFNAPITTPVPPMSASSSHTQTNMTSEQASLLPSIDLTAGLPSVSLDPRAISPDPVSIVPTRPSHSRASDTVSTYAPNYVPLLAGPTAVGSASVAAATPVVQPLLQATPSVPTPLAPPILGQGSVVPPLATLNTQQSPSVITHTAASKVTPSDAATTFSQGSGFPSPVVSCRPTATLPSPALQPPQTFAMPRPIQPALPVKKPRPVKPIVSATTISSPHLILAPFPGQASTLIVTQPLKAEVVPTTGQVAISSPAVGRAGFHILSQTQNPPQLIVPKEETGPSSSNCKTPTPPTNAVRDRRCSGQGSPCGSEQAPSPQSPHNTCNSLAKNESNQNRRVNHISAEQKRRFNINVGFKTLCGLVPTLKSQSNLKPISNAATLQKTVEYIGKLQQERLQIQEETRRLREEIEELNSSINSCQEQLPATGVLITRHRFDHMREKFDEYVRSRTLQNWKFWIFSIILKPLFESFNRTVSTTSMDELYQTTMQWLEQHCSLPVLRPMVLHTLRQLSVSTSILTDPSLLPEEALQAVTDTRTPVGQP
ncbi:MLX-interacting protein isoform X1 [Paramormyrops kingsleyae]|uniref:MLX interacting protein n=1 Tax=Paramormyrops kingsleyae TaxID=1676925 RepID=A0A3B3QNF7_9TELE|nr:MLX-interacting protein isoform X1 [Paramormyrops kingsleyae]